MHRRIIGFIHGIPRTLRNYWGNKYESKSNNRISRGAANLFKTITCAHNDGWRRHENKKPKQH